MDDFFLITAQRDSVRQRIRNRLGIPTFRGNRGNLLQHWVLVELVGSLRQQAFAKLAFIDANSMSPTASRSPKAATDQTASDFHRVKARLAGGDRRTSMLGERWANRCGPSIRLRPRLCGIAGRVVCIFSRARADRPTADQIAVWLSGLDEHSTSFERHRGD